MKKYLARLKKHFTLSSLQIVDSLCGTDKAIRKKMEYWGYDSGDYRFTKEQIAFIHIPKTGGSTLAALLSQDPQQRFLNFRIHKPVSKWCAPSDFRYITVLRNPVDRVWSLYKMTLTDPDGHHYRKLAEKGLETFLKKYWAATNIYCRYFSGKVFEEPDESTLDLALGGLQCFDSVLDFSDLENEIRLIGKKYDLKIDNIPHKRKSNNEELTTEQRALISKYNALDIRLYQAWLARNGSALTLQTQANG